MTCRPLSTDALLLAGGSNGEVNLGATYLVGDEGEVGFRLRIGADWLGLTGRIKVADAPVLDEAGDCAASDRRWVALTVHPGPAKYHDREVPEFARTQFDRSGTGIGPIGDSNLRRGGSRRRDRDALGEQAERRAQQNRHTEDAAKRLTPHGWEI